MLVAMVSPARAWFDFHRSTEVTKINTAFVDSSTQAGAFTGENTQLSGVAVEKAGLDDIHYAGTNNLTTGVANSNATSRLMVNTSFGCDNCLPTQQITRYTEMNMAKVNTQTMTQAETGLNVQQNSVSVEKAHLDDISSHNCNWLKTGTANSTATSLNLVNVEWNHDMVW
jgi:hypothetical protein